MSTLRIARRNLGRNLKRTALALGAIALAQTAVLLMDGMLKGYGDAMLDAFTGPMLGHVQLHAPGFTDEEAIDLTITDVDAKLKHVREVPGVETATARVFAPALVALGEQGFVGVVVGLDTTAERGPRGLLGTAPGVPERITAGEVLVGARLARDMGVKLGDELAIVGQGADGSIANDLYRVVGTINSSVEIVQATGLVMPIAAAQELFAMPDEAHEITVHGAEPSASRELAERLAADPQLAGLEVKTWQDLAPELTTMLKLNDVFTWVLLLLVFVAAAAGVANTMLMATFERNRELGMLLSLGCSPGRIVAMIALEALMLGLLGILVGSVIGVGANMILADMGIDMVSLGGGEGLGDLSFAGVNYGIKVVPRTSIVSVLGGVGAVTATSLLASLWPALHAARLQPVEAMRG